MVHRPRWTRKLPALGDLTNNLQVVVSVGIAILVALTAVVASQAGGTWQDSVRAEVKSSAAMIELAGHVYGFEAPGAFELAALEIRADRLAAAGRAAGSKGTAALVEADALRQTAETMRSGQTGNGLITDDKYRDASGSYDVVRRLNDLQTAEAAGLTGQPESLRAQGDNRRTWALVLAVATLLLIVFYCVAQAVISRKRARTRTAGADVGLAPNLWSGRPDLLKVVVFCAWLLVTLVPSGQIVASLNEQRQQALAARTAVELSGDIAVSQAVNAFRTNSLLSSVERTTHGLTRENVVLTPGTAERVVDEQTTIARADQSLMPYLKDLVDEMGQLPSKAAGTDARTSAAVSTSPGDWERSLALQGSQVERAAAAGHLANMLQLTVVLAALAFSTATLATVRRGVQARSLTITATTLLTTAVLTILLAF